MPNYLARRVRDRQPKGAREAGQYADTIEYDSASKDSQAKKSDWNSTYKKPEQSGFRPTSGNPPFKGSTNPFSRPTGPQPTAQKAPNFNERGQPKCFSCGTYGHMRKDCTKQKVQMNLVGLEEKPRLIVSGTIEGVNSDDLQVDTGANLTTIHPRLVPKECYLDQRVTVHTSTGGQGSLRTARVTLEVRGKVHKLRVAVSRISHDGLIGLDFLRIGSLAAEVESELYPLPSNNLVKLDLPRGRLRNSIL